MNEFMHLAIEEARNGIENDHGGPFGAVVVKDGEVIASAHNDVIKKNDPTSHAEIEAIRKASARLNTHDLYGCVLYTTGKPCPMCRGAIQWAKIEVVYFGCDYEDAEEIGFNEYTGNSDSYVEQQINQEECKKLYDEYSLLKRESY